ncbi:MAG: hypothetical protein N3A53_05655 [Verrucomicrobiae bacterium]|nr:hypothetical protein [Verrucomicrobiae bacterium]
MKKAMIMMLATFGAVVLLLGGVKVMQVRAAIEAGHEPASLALDFAPAKCAAIVFDFVRAKSLD